MLDSLAELNRSTFEMAHDPETNARIAQYEMAFRMQTAVPDLVDLSNETMATQRIDIQSSLVHKVEVNGWTLSVDDRVLRRLSSLRESKLPVETGGILIGGVDTLHKRLYVVEVVGSPPDSIEESGGYVRGVEGLSSIRERFGKLTDFQLDYVGEWHSHPRGCKTSPSEEDSVLMKKLKIDRAKDCLPALMAIVGDNGRSSWYFDSVNHSADLYMEIVNT